MVWTVTIFGYKRKELQRTCSSSQPPAPTHAPSHFHSYGLSQNYRSCGSLFLPLFSCPARVSTSPPLCLSLEDALSISSSSKRGHSQIWLCSLSIVSPIIVLHYLLVERGRKCDPRARYCSYPPLRRIQNTSDVIFERQTQRRRCRNLNGQESSRRQGKGCYKFVILAY